MCSQEIVGMLDCLHVLHESKIVISRIEDGLGALKSLMQSAQSYNTMLDRWLDVA
jgi:hypothetical protein